MLKTFAKRLFILWVLCSGYLWAGSLYLPTEREIAQKPATADAAKYRFQQDKPALAVACSADGMHGFSAGGEGIVYRWDLTTGSKVQVYKGPGESITHLTVFADEQALLAAGPNVLEMRSLADGARLAPLPKLDDMVLSSVAKTPDASIVAVGYRQIGNIVLWDRRAGKVLPPLAGHYFGILAVAFTPNARQLISVGFDGTVRLWALSTSTEVRRFEINGSQDSVIAIDPATETLLVSGGRMPFVCRWDIGDGEQVNCLNNGEALWVTSLAIAPGGQRALSGGPKGDVTLWNLDTGQALRQFNAYSTVYDVAVCPNSEYGLSASEDGVVNVWDLREEKLL